MKRFAAFATLAALFPLCSFATYPVNDAIGNSTLRVIRGLNDEQVQLLGKILSENRSQLETLKAINDAIGGQSSGSSFAPQSFAGTFSPTIGGATPSSLPNGTASNGLSPMNINPSGGQVVGGVLQGGAGILRSGGVNASNTGTLTGAVTGNRSVGTATRDGIDSVTRGAGYARNPDGLSVNNAASVISGLPGGSEAVNTVRSALPQNDYLSMFMGMSVGDFKRAFASPSAFVSSSIMGKVLGDAGKATGAGPEIMFAARVGSMSEEQRAGNRTRIAADMADMLGARVLANVEENAKKSEKFAMDTKVSDEKARAADNLNSRLAVSIEHQTIANEMMLEASKQQALSDAAAASAQAAQADLTLLQEKRLRTEQNFRTK